MSPAALQPELAAPGFCQLLSLDADPAVRIAFTGRRPAAGAPSGNLSLVVGDGDVATARAAALRLVGATPATAVFMQQVHGGNTAVVTAADAGRGARDYDDAIRGVDALVTHDPGVALAVLVADCVPVVLVDPGRGVGAVHAGRGGVVAGVIADAVGKLAPHGAGNVTAVIGPAVGGCCYEVPAALADEVAAVVAAARATTTWGSASLDLPAAVEQQLRAAGVGDVRRMTTCTRCSHQDFFSHRATTAGLAPAGRQAAIVMRAGDGDGSGRPAATTGSASLESPRSP